MIPCLIHVADSAILKNEHVGFYGMGMEANQTPRLTPKGRQTRERLLDAALKFFAEKGYAATTMRDIAAATETSLGLTYRYFASKDELVLALYMRLTAESEADVQSLRPAPLAERFALAMQHKLAQMEPYRDAFRAIIGPALAPQSDAAVLGERTADIRRQAGQMFLTLVLGSTDAPRDQQARDLATVLYAGHLLLLLFWLHDPSPHTRATHELLALSRDMLALGRRLLRLRPIAKALARVAQTIEPVFGSAL
jgi:AcrR family transcriptional regulator